MSDRISEHISLKEAIKSNTATRLGIDNIPREKITKFYNRYFWLEKLREVYGDNSIDIAMSKIKKNKDTNYDKYQTTPKYLEVTKRF